MYALQATYFYITDKTVNERTHLNFSSDRYSINGASGTKCSCGPKLVVGLTIDQLRTDYIEAFSALYGERGFKRLWKEGRIYLNAEYDFINVDKSSSVAAIYSGTTPYTNGIVGDNWMDRATLRVINCVDDNNFMGDLYFRVHLSCQIESIKPVR